MKHIEKHVDVVDERRSSREYIFKIKSKKLTLAISKIFKPYLKTLSDVFKNISRCNYCGGLKSNTTNCNNCESVNKNYNKICVVENISDQWSIENSNIFQGYYHVLGGTVSNSKDNERNELLIESLVHRIERDNIEEVILATSATVEGQTTAFYINESLKNSKVKISKLAQGLPVGGEIESLDDGTLIYAFKNRKALEKN